MAVQTFTQPIISAITRTVQTITQSTQQSQGQRRQSHKQSTQQSHGPALIIADTAKENVNRLGKRTLTKSGLEME